MMEQLALGEKEVTSWVRRSKAISSVVKLPGDASTRKYYRVFTKGAPKGGPKSLIVMRMEPFTEQAQQVPFLSVGRHLSACGVDVPQVLDIDPAKGLILLEDLGDITLLRHLQEVANPEVERHIYQRVIDSLVALQLRASGRKGKRPALEGFKLRFDTEKLMWEVGFTMEHFYKLHLKREIPARDLKVIKDGFTEICELLDGEPTVLAHRDFHSRNLMVIPGKNIERAERFVMIDFQDARMGPAQYDLASLLKDSYYQLEESQIQRLLDYYVARWEAESGERVNRPHFERVFDLMGVQRNFKAIGSFASFDNRRGNPTYLKYIGNTFENIRRTLLKYPEYTRLRETLFHYYYF